jgi:DNA polymerase-3 subunit delta'
VSWQRVLGHEAIAEGFGRLRRRGRLGHAYLFAGSAGIGKRLFAEELAKALLCERRDGERFEACDQCPACKQIEAGSHPDLMIVQRPPDVHELPIESIRALCKTFALKSARGRGKVAIVDNADDLNEAAANCFLKTLEEPPPGSVLILIASTSDLQLPTIVSRCQIVHFHALPTEVIEKLLQVKGLDDAAAIKRLVQHSDGSVGRALALADPGLWAFRRMLIAALASPSTDSVALAKSWMQFVEDAGKESAAQRRRATLTIDFAIEFLEAALVLSQGGAPRSLEEDSAHLQGLVRRLSTDQLLQSLECCLEAAWYIDRRVQLVLVLEALADSLARQLRS